jgi:CRP/FNR family transcriptional regulator
VDSGLAIEIEQAELFRVLSPQRLARLKPLLREKPFQRQRVLYFESEPAERLWVVRSGEVRLYKSSPSGHVTTLDVLGPGEIFGAVSALEAEVYSSSAEAVSQGRAWWLPRQAFVQVVNEEPAAALEILQIVSRRLREAHDRLRAFAHDPAPARLARALLHAAPGGTAHVTRRALAEAAGTTVETAIRVLRRFEREGLVKGEVGVIHVLDAASLRALASGSPA